MLVVCHKSSLNNKRLTFSLLIWLLLASSVAYSLDLECYLESNGACTQVCSVPADDPCDEPLHLSPPSYLPTPCFELTIALTEEQGLCGGIVGSSSLGRSSDFLPVGLRAPPSTLL